MMNFSPCLVSSWIIIEKSWEKPDQTLGHFKWKSYRQIQISKSKFQFLGDDAGVLFSNFKDSYYQRTLKLQLPYVLNFQESSVWENLEVNF